MRSLCGRIDAGPPKDTLNNNCYDYDGRGLMV
jgi:hypothetical protein